MTSANWSGSNLFVFKFVVREAIARIPGTQDLHRVSTEFDEIDFALLIDYKREAVRNSGLCNINAVLLRHLTIEEITQQRK